MYHKLSNFSVIKVILLSQNCVNKFYNLYSGKDLKGRIFLDFVILKENHPWCSSIFKYTHLVMSLKIFLVISINFNHFCGNISVNLIVAHKNTC